MKFRSIKLLLVTGSALLIDDIGCMDTTSPMLLGRGHRMLENGTLIIAASAFQEDGNPDAPEEFEAHGSNETSNITYDPTEVEEGEEQLEEEMLDDIQYTTLEEEAFQDYLGLPDHEGTEFVEDHDVNDLVDEVVSGRHLTQKIGDFATLSCNEVEAFNDCASGVSTLGADLTNPLTPLTIPCGKCYVFDLGDVDIAGGIHVKGHLKFPNNYNAVVTTPSIIVEGKLSMSSDKPVSTASETLRFVLTGDSDVFFGPEQTNVAACQSMPGGRCNLGVKPIFVAGGSLDIMGLQTGCQTWAKVKDIDASGQGILLSDVDTSISSCWGTGAKLHITSSSFDSADGLNVIIDSVTTTAIGDAHISLTEAIPSSEIITEAKSLDFAVEVMLLDRNIKFEGGGYLQILHTPEKQLIDGVEFNGMGQAGRLNRYPLQMLYSGSVVEAVVSRNSIVASNQRCIAIEGTSDVTVKSNTAYDIPGICYLVGFNAERNSFEKNIVAHSKRFRNRFHRLFWRGDDIGASYASWFPNNDFVENVAAGGQGCGFVNWLQHWTANEALGNSRLGNPRRFPYGTFRGNEAHSYYYQGLDFRHFEQGLNKNKEGLFVIESSKSYRNKSRGAYFHWGQGIKLVDVLVADNHIGIEYAYTEDVFMENVDIQGLTSVTKSANAANNKLWICSRQRTVIGLRTPGTQLRPWAGKNGVTQTGTKFSGFDYASQNGCWTSDPYSFIDWTFRDKHWSYTTTLSNMSEAGASGKIANFCYGKNKGVDDILMYDVDGSLDPTGTATGLSSIVSDNEKMTSWGECSKLTDQCLAYCPNQCLRTVSYLVEHGNTDDMLLEVTRDDGKSFSVTGKVENENHDVEWKYRKFSISLAPNSNYTVAFIDANSEKTWPLWALQEFDNSPTCDHIKSDSIVLHEPTVDTSVCENIVPNSNMESGASNWKKNGGRIELASGGVDSSAASLRLTARRSPWHYLGTHLDTRCHRQTDVKYYEIQGYIRLERGGAPADCNPFNNVWHSRCPKFSIKYQGYNDASKESHWTHYNNHAGEIVFPYKKDEWNEVHKVIRVNDKLADAEKMFLYMENAHRTDDLYLDNVSVRPYTPPSDSSCTELVQNGKFKTDAKWWWRWGHAKLEIVEGVDGPGDFALKSYDRNGWYSDSQRQDLFMDCVKGGDRIILSAKYKVQKAGKDIKCNKYSWWSSNERCPDIFMFNRKSGQRDHYRKAAQTVEVAEDADIQNGWNLIHDIYTFPEGRENPNLATLFFDGLKPRIGLDLIVDDVSAKVIPQDCSNLILNGDFNDGTAKFWRNWDRHLSRLKLVAGAGGVGYALANYQRGQYWQGMRQHLDSRCFVEGARFEISAKFMLLKGTSEEAPGAGAMCKTNSRSTGGSCPRVRIYATGCSEGSRDRYWLSFWNDQDYQEWNPTSFNDFKASFYVDPIIASCKTYEVVINNIESHLDVVVDDLSISLQEAEPSASSPQTNDAMLDEKNIVEPPTAAPTSMTPKISTVSSCPHIGSAFDIGHGPILLERSNVLCTLTKIDTVGGNVIPIARSYEGNDWEIAGGSFATTLLGSEMWQCYASGCQITLPEGFYRISSYNHTLPQKKDKVARLLLSTTFGPTWDEVSAWSDFTDETIADYVESQMNAEMTSHREFFRKRANPRFHFSQYSATPNHPCHQNSRWRKFAFTVKDAFTGWTTEKVQFKQTAQGAYIMESAKTKGNVDGSFHVRAVIPEAVFETGTGDVQFEATYTFCHSLQERVDGAMHLWLNGACRRIRNPKVDFTGNEGLLTNGFIDLGDHTKFHSIDDALSNGDELIYIGTGITGSICDGLTHHVDELDPPIYGKLDDGTWLVFDPRLELQDNTIDAPISDGGMQLRTESLEITRCSNVPRSFLNEENCILSIPEAEAEVDCSSTGNLVCGSPGEVANDPTLGNYFDFATGLDTSRNFDRQREQIWTMIALDSHDQLRQRVAHALSQILVMVKDAIDAQSRQTESFCNYHDIFVKHAFGNYGDILKEVSYSPLMGENLSYRSSKSAAYMRRRYNKNDAFPDENYAREFMQLFTIGVYRLSQDGSIILDEVGEPVETYSNDHIMSFARAWTGFERHSVKRGNVQDSGGWGNHIDPMKIEASWRDISPKNDVLGGYIGDSYPLCEDLPDSMFLKKGAKYRFLGTSNLSELGGQDPSEFATDDSVVTFVLDPASPLKGVLCGGNVQDCQFSNSVTLDSNLDCHGAECLVDTVRVVDVGGFFYEYIRPACVEQAFFSGAKKLSQRNRGYEAICGNPLLPVASGACCNPNHYDSVSHWYQGTIEGKEYDGERTTYATAENRCAAVGKVTCDFDHIAVNSSQYFKLGYHWTDEPCKIRVKVDDLGNIAVRHLTSNLNHAVYVDVDEGNENYFKAYWDNDQFPKVSTDNCSGCDVVGNSCVCDVDVRKYRVFTEERMPRSVEDIKSNLYIGAIDPITYGDGTYTKYEFSMPGIIVYTKDSTIQGDTIFAVKDETGRTLFFKNTRETVRLQDTNGVDVNFKFRNAPQFMSVNPKETASRDAHFETQAVIDHFFYHPNTAPFISKLLIQRFGISNPTPTYVNTVAGAFKSGSYTFGAKKFGSEKYGCLASTIAAILLDREARSVILEADPSYGGLKEPLLKVTGVMRSMEFKAMDSRPVVKLNGMANRIGMMAHSATTVFGFFSPDYKSGVSGDAGLVSPESIMLDMPKDINFLNGMFSLPRHGLSSCRSGFGESVGWNSCTIGNYDQASGALTLGSASNSTEYVHRLATLLTAGRLSTESREIIAECSDAMQYAHDKAYGPIHALTLLMATPEFHSNNLSKKSGQTRESYLVPESSGGTYKALVYIMLSGGCDSYSILVPHTCGGTDAFYEEYKSVRGEVALPRDSLRVVDTDGQVCEKFGLHNKLPNVHNLYQNEKSLLFFANTGVITQPSTKSNYWKNSATALFNHHTMQKEAQRVNPYNEITRSGIFGRMRDAVTTNGYNAGSFNIDSTSHALVGEPGKSEGPSTVSRHGTNPFNEDSPAEYMMEAITALNEATTADSGIFAEQWSTEMLHSLAKNEKLHTELSNTQTTTTFPNSHLGQQLAMVSRLIATREERGVDRDVFFVTMGGFDTHRSNNDRINNLFSQLDSAIGSFAAELKSMGVWGSVTTVQTSDFARTIVPNSGVGTDHAWGGNYMMFGGDVKGGQVKGTFPDKLTPDGDRILPRGRVIPTTAWDSVFKAVAEWYGVAQDQLDDVCPNAHRFEGVEGYSNFDVGELFGASGVTRRNLRKGKAGV